MHASCKPKVPFYFLQAIGEILIVEPCMVSSFSHQMIKDEIAACDMRVNFTERCLEMTQFFFCHIRNAPSDSLGTRCNHQ